MSLKIDRLQLEIIINNDQARKQLRALEDESRKLKKQLKKVPEGSAEWKKINDRLKSIQTQHDKLISKLGIEKLSLKELTQRQRELNAIMRNLDPSTKAYKKLEKQLIAVKNRQAQLRVSANKTNFSLKKIAGNFNHYFGAITAGVASLTGVVYLFKNIIKKNAELSDSFADVRKTTGLTDAEVKLLYKDLKKIDTRSANSELLSLARIAGKLGVEGKENVLGFVNAADKINVALSEDLGGNVEESIRQVGKLVDIFKIEDKFGLEQGLLKVGSAINALGASSTANEAYIVEFSKRVAGLAPNANISAADVFGLAATLDQLGQTSEVSSTVFGKLLVLIGKDVPKFAKLAGMSINDFNKLLSEDANEALLKVLDGAKSTEGGVVGMAKSLEALGVNGQRSAGVLGVLTKNVDLLREQQKLSNDEFTKGTSLTNEFNLKNENLAAKIAKLKKVWSNFITTSGFRKFTNGIVDGMINIFSSSNETSKALEKEREQVNRLTIKLTDSNIKENERRKILKKLNTINPDIVKGLKAENIEVKKLFKNLDKYNDAIANKIVLLQLNNKETKLLNKVGRIRAKKIELETDLLLKIKDADENIIATKKTLAERTKTAINLLVKEGASVDEFTKKSNIYVNKSGMVIDNRSKEQKLLDEILLISSRRNILLNKENKLMGDVSSFQKRIKIMKDLLGISDKIDSNFNPNPDPDSNSDPDSNPDNNFKEKLDAEAKFRQQLINGSKSLIEQENIAYRERLKKAGLFNKEKENMTKQELQALEVLNNNHKKNIDNIEDKAISNELKKQKELFDNITIQRKTDYNNQLAALGNDEEAKKQLKEKFRREEIERQKVFLEKLSQQLTTSIESGEFNGLDIGNSLLSPEQKESLLNRLAEVKLQLAQLKAQLPGADPNENEESGDFLGMSDEDWEKFNSKINKALELAGQLSDIWGAFNQAQTNREQEELNKFEKNNEAKKNALEQRLKDGLISQKVYDNKRQALDDKYEKKKNEYAEKQAKRDKAQAIASTIINTAESIIKTGAELGYPAAIPWQVLAGTLGLAKIGVIASTPLPQYALGNYEDILAQDGKIYQSKIADKKHKSGMFSEPTFVPGFGLFGETPDPELVFNPADTKTIMNTPALINAINHTLGFKQFAQGNAREIIKETNTVTETFTDPDMIKAMNRFSNTVDKLQADGIPAHAILDEDYIRYHNKLSEDYNKFINK